MTKKSKAKSKASGKSKSSAKRKGKPPRSPRVAWSIATEARKPVGERVAALAEVSLALDESAKNPDTILKIVRDKNEAPDVRLGALQALQGASFSSATYESWRGDYIATLREITDDPHSELRQRALGILSREKDGYAQKKLLEGLENPEKALVAPEKALQLLGNDVHAEAYSVAREIVEKPPNEAAKREALRLLAADAAAAPMFEKVLRDKNELAENRQISASALQALKPEKFQEYAREILMDKSEYDDIKATSLTALTQFGNAEAVAQDTALMDRVDSMKEEKSTKVKKSARRFLTKYGAK